MTTGVTVDAEPLLDVAGELGAAFGLARRDGHVGAGLRQQAGGAHADRTGGGGDDRAAALDVARLLQLDDRGDGGGVRAVRVEHHRDAHRAEERLFHDLEQPLAGGHVGAADEDRGVVQVLRARA